MRVLVLLALAVSVRSELLAGGVSVISSTSTTPHQG